jgi:hypothetical protein
MPSMTVMSVIGSSTEALDDLPEGLLLARVAEGGQARRQGQEGVAVGRDHPAEPRHETSSATEPGALALELGVEHVRDELDG